MRIQFAKGTGLEFTIGGEPDIMEHVDPEDAQFIVAWSSDPYKLAKQLEAAATWVRKMHIRYPTDYVDCIIENINNVNKEK